MSALMCSEKVRHGSGWTATRKACGKTAKTEHEGRHFCGMHDPVKRAAKRDETDARWRKEAAEARRLHTLRAAAPDLLAACEGALAELDFLVGGLRDEGLFLSASKVSELADAARAAIAKAKGIEFQGETK